MLAPAERYPQFDPSLFKLTQCHCFSGLLISSYTVESIRYGNVYCQGQYTIQNLPGVVLLSCSGFAKLRGMVIPDYCAVDLFWSIIKAEDHLNKQSRKEDKRKEDSLNAVEQ